jgi:TPP-dependent 2-oxoacid decarboxylase
MSSSTSRQMTIGEFLLRRLKEAGVRHLFGVPGDYNLELLQQLQDTDALRWVGTCSELNASYAADGYARLNGLGALLVTNGVGALSAINGVGGCYSEHVPVICIAGSIPLRSIDRGLGMHHTMADGTWDHFLNAYAHVTAAHARLTPRNAATEIDRLILTAWREKLPVYLELSSDIAYLDIEVPTSPLVLAHCPSDPERLRSCIAAIALRLSGATSPAILVDADADRFGVALDLMALADKIQAPIAVIDAAKAVVDETFAHYLGIYNGKASDPQVRQAIETSDCLLAIGHRPIEVTTGDFTASLPANTIHARGHSVDVGDDNYQAVTRQESTQGRYRCSPARHEPRSTEGCGSGSGRARSGQRFGEAHPSSLLAGHAGVPSGGRRSVRRQRHVVRSLRPHISAEMHVHRIGQLGVDRLLGRCAARHTHGSAGTPSHSVRG